jgi:Bacterial CdiA-CT RNAse A domain
VGGPVRLAGLRNWLRLIVCVTALLRLWGCAQGSAPAANSEAEPARQAPAAVVDRYDLGHDEEHGGHTLKKHVGRTDEQLQERLRRERNISAASAWTDRETAEVTVAEALRAERGRIEKWMRRGYPRANLALHYDAGRAIGRSLRRGEEQSVNCTSAVIVLRADGLDSFYVLTTYPEARE